MTSTQIRQSFLDFFKSKQHTVVPSSSLMPDAPNLLFTNAGMNQFVPIFLGQVKCPYTPGRAADTQKCIRAGGKHNDLEDVGLDTYHHTFFEMLGNWSFGDYFKQEAIEWAWELVTEVWRFPKNRLYATVYQPGPGEPSAFDQEAYDHWARLFSGAGLDPKIHICTGGKKDNFWMMGDTGPCGPCSELHVDLTPQGDTRGALVNQGSAQCIEIWNLVFMQFNANPDGTFSPLPARSVDTGMGFERVTGIIQNTQGFTDFSRIISNYETDIFRPIFDQIEQLSGKRYGSTLPTGESQISNLKSQIAVDVAFRVIADHIRTLSFAIADGIQPGNTDRNYVLRRILRRAVRYGRTLGFHQPFFYKLVEVLAETMGDVFPEIRAKQRHVEEVIRVEEEAFNKTLDDGLRIFERSVWEINSLKQFLNDLPRDLAEYRREVDSLMDIAISAKSLEELSNSFFQDVANGPMTPRFVESLQEDVRKKEMQTVLTKGVTVAWTHQFSKLCRPATAQFEALEKSRTNAEAFETCRGTLRQELTALEMRLPALRQALDTFPGDMAFMLYDTYGFPLDLTELMARERGLAVDVKGFNDLMKEQKARARAAQKKSVISISEIGSVRTRFVGYDLMEADCRVLNTSQGPGGLLAVVDVSPLYAEMGGQVGDTGVLRLGNQSLKVLDTGKQGDAFLLRLEVTDEEPWLPLGEAPQAHLEVDTARRNAIQRHHTVTHLLHWALHEVVSRDAAQKGSFVGPDKLTFDFNSAPLTPQQLADVEKLVNERILDNAGVSWVEVKYSHVKDRKDVMQFFGDKYGEWVRVVQIGGQPTGLDGYSMELCGGTHTRATGEIGLFRIVSEGTIAAGVRRIEAVAGLEAYARAQHELQLIKSIAGKVNSPLGDLEKKIESLLEQQRALEKQLKALQQKETAGAAKNLVNKAVTINGIPAIIENLGGLDGDTLQGLVNELRGQFKGVIVLGGAASGAVALVASVSPEFSAKVQAGRIIQQIAPIVGGQGGGKPDNARGGGKDASKLDEALARAAQILVREAKT